MQAALFELQDQEYRNYICKLVPTVDSDRVIGIRTPVLRSFCKRNHDATIVCNFLQSLPHTYFEENNLHALYIEHMHNFDACIFEVERFLPFVDNWATCDSLRPKCFRKNLMQLLPYIKKWLNSKHPYTVRFGIEMLMLHYLDVAFKQEYADMVSQICSADYYVDMMIAWYFATALAKQYEKIIPYIQQHRLSPWIHNKAIQKALESYRISDGQKNVLRMLKIKPRNETFI